jgi:DNA-binding LacI/PurR family transcriptional regulator
MVTIAQIAAEANVSSALVSRVLNDKPGVSPENRTKILKIIKKHNYVPNASARSLVTNKTRTIGVVMDSLCDAFFFDLISGMQYMAEELDYNIVFCSGYNDSRIKLKYVNYYIHGRADGVIAYGSRSDELFNEIIEKAPHFVIVEGDVPDKVFNKVQVNNFNSAYRAVKHLIDLGYKDIVHFTGDMEYNVSKERRDGYIKAMQDNTLPVRENIIYADFGEEIAYEKMKELIRKNKTPEACFAGADKAAFGILRAMFEYGLSAPEDIALIGFDGDVPDSRDIVFPKLTTMKQPLFEMGKEAIRLLVKTIEDPDALAETIVFDAELILGETCK